MRKKKILSLTTAQLSVVWALITSLHLNTMNQFQPCKLLDKALFWSQTCALIFYDCTIYDM